MTTLRKNRPAVANRNMGWAGSLLRYLVFLAIFSMSASPISAKIVKTLGRALESQALTLTVGSALEYQTDSEQTVYDFPFLLERSLAPDLKLTLEPNYIYVHSTVGPSVHGFGELEAALTYDFLAERRNRPGLSALGLIKFPTASHAALGTGTTDFSLGVIAGKEFVHTDLDLNVIYTFVGSAPGENLQNTIEASLALEWHISRSLDLVGELLAMNGAGRSHGQSGSIGGLAGSESTSELSVTLGAAEHLSEDFKLEQGVIVQSDGSWQAVVAWEWAVGGGD